MNRSSIAVSMPASLPSDRHAEFAPAKINLFLHVGAKRADGFHDLESLVVFADVGDKLTFERDDALSLDIAGPFGGGLSRDDNLVLKAARLLMARAGRGALGARIALRKELPVASGIGGGSADAAATLRGLSKLWDLNLIEAELLALAARLGSDVPVCLASRAAIISGRGEKIAQAPALPKLCLLLVNPMVGISTAEVFARFDRASHPPPEGGSKFANASEQISGRGRDLDAFIGYLGATRNDLEAPARAIAPVIGDILNEIAHQPGVLLTRMSGSGATCFGIFEDEAAAKAAATAIRSGRSDWWVAETRSPWTAA